MRNSRIMWALILAHGCGPEFTYQTLEADAAAFCEHLVECEDLPGPVRYAAKCENELLDHGDDALDEGARCAKSYSRLVHCFTGLSCEEYWTWGDNHANIDQSVEYPCDKQTDDFLDECDDTFFAIYVKR